MIATLILPTCGKRIAKPLVEPQSSLDSMASQPAKKGKETWKDYFTKDWTARKVLTVGTAGLAIILAMGYTIKTARTSYKSYRARKELEAALAFQEEMVEGMIKEEPTQQELEAFKEHQKIDRNLPVFRQPIYQVDVRKKVKRELYEVSPAFIKRRHIVIPTLVDKTKKCVLMADVSQDFLTYKFKKHHNNEAPKSNSNLRLNGEHTAGDYIFCKDNKWYEVRDQE
jgi:hypothetical protein